MVKAYVLYLFTFTNTQSASVTVLIFYSTKENQKIVFPPLLMTDLMHNLQDPPSNVRSK